jgi:hypothetical protein
VISCRESCSTSSVERVSGPRRFRARAEGKNLLGLPDCMPVAPIIAGHPKEAAPPVPRNRSAVRWVG